ncbi:unnamed protein product, partial [Closterium sp. NIES-54]
MATPHEEASKEDVPMTSVDELEDFPDLDLNAEDVIGDLPVEEEEALGNQEENGEQEGLDDLDSDDNFPEEFEKLQSTVAEQASSLLQQKRRVSELETQLAEQNASMDTIKAQLNKVTAKPRQFKRSLGLKANQIKSLEDTLQQLNATCINLESTCTTLQAQYRELRRGGIYRPPPTNGQPSTSAGAPTEQPMSPDAPAFGSLPTALPNFIHGKTNVESWLHHVEEFLSIHNVRPELQ